MIKIRRAHKEDVDAVSELFDAYRVWYRKESDSAGAKEFLRDRIAYNESVIYLAEDENVVVGFTQLYPIFSSTRMQQMWLLNDLYVIKAQRGKGIGRALIEKSQALSKQTAAAGILLETEVTNEAGNHLYPSLGFKLEKNNFYFWS